MAPCGVRRHCDSPGYILEPLPKGLAGHLFRTTVIPETSEAWLTVECAGSVTPGYILEPLPKGLAGHLFRTTVIPETVIPKGLYGF